MRKVLKFQADWCQPCKMLTNMIKDIKTDIPIEIVDADADHETCSKYKIRGIPTLIMLDDDVEVKRLVGMTNQQALETWLNG